MQSITSFPLQTGFNSTGAAIPPSGRVPVLTKVPASGYFHQMSGIRMLPTSPTAPVAPAATGTAATPSKSAKRKKEDTRSPELTYAEELAKNTKYGVKDQLLYQWCGSHYEQIDSQKAERHALKWLALYFPERATCQTAKSCVAAAIVLVSQIPERDPKRTIIPLRNAYLEVMPDSSILRHAPDPSFGMTFSFKINLAGTGKTYTPLPLPMTSLLARYLDTSLPDRQVQDYLQELLGDTLTPTIRFQVALLLKGGGRNGKSVLVKLLSALHDRVAHMRLNAMSGFGLMPLVDASLVVVDEVPHYVGPHEAQILKSCISGESIDIDRKYLSQISIRPTARWILSTNNDQKSRDNSTGFWRRLTVVPFTHQVPEDQVIPGLEDKIIDSELHLLLDWCLIGLQRLMVRGKLPSQPMAVQNANHQATVASNSIAAWIEDEGVAVGTNESHDLAKAAVFTRYRDWCRSNNLGALSMVSFWTGLRALLAIPDHSQVRVGKQRVRFVRLQFQNDLPEVAGPHPFDA